MNVINKLLIAISLPIITSFSCLLISFYNMPDIIYTSYNNEESREPLNNPYCGFYRICGYMLSDDSSVEAAVKWCDGILSDYDRQLVLLEFNLMNYRNTELSDNALHCFDTILGMFSDSHIQIILRPLYDWDGKAKDTEPKDINIILKHIEQLAPYINSHADSILIMQGNLTGNCGEMNSPYHTSDEELKQLHNCLDKNINSGIFLSVRTPAHLRTIIQSFTPLNNSTPFSGALASRLGLFNDGMLGSVFDLGTYDDTPLTDASPYNDKGTRKEEIAYQNELCNYVPNGGEVTLDNPYNDLDNAIKDMNSMHVSYLNIEHNRDVLDKWEATTYKNRNNKADPYNGMNGLEYVDRHLGYRYVLRESTLTQPTLFNHNITLTVSIENTGFSVSYRDYEGTLYLVSDDNTETTIPLDTDTRLIIPGEKKEISTEIDAGTLESGHYKILYELKDSVTGKTIKFANEKTDESGRVYIGELQAGS